MNRSRLEQIFGRFGGLNVAIIGDLFLDRWYEIDESLNEPSLETGLTAYQVVKKRSAPGAAGCVINNFCGMGIGKVEAVSFVGRDGDGWELLEKLRRLNVGVSNVIVSDEVMTPSYIKPLFPNEGNRFDVKNFAPTPIGLQNGIIDRIKAVWDRSDALVVIEQVCEREPGVITDRVREAICQMASADPDKLVFVDSRAFIHLYHDVIIKCNNLEAARMTGREPNDGAFDENVVFECMDELMKKTRRPVIVTCNRHGVAVNDINGKLLTPAVRHNCPIDICGAGDACTAGLVSALCAGATYREASVVGNLSSGVTVRQLGQTGAASQNAMLALFDEQNRPSPDA